MPQLKWHCRPSNWKIDNHQLVVHTEASTDFWQNTHYGFQTDNGHFLHAVVKDNFIIETEVQCQFVHQYDQAGLMVRVSDQCWVKTFVEFEPGEANNSHKPWLFRLVHTGCGQKFSNLQIENNTGRL